ncbi:hypothetical protein I4F81_000408 [Pyropia yezoensis]|uniref:Uncharacterized protein n=1 Tax=Pyropia yezoensis TaxID=2788 RepID=A0ACC3BJN9_PYRYE|nr:hypothetical protein I4F81_000408 [Neopyropia yezoensis]
MESFVGGPGHGGGSGSSDVKYVLVSGGVISGIGKGLTASSIGVLLKACGWRVTAVKVDPYLNCDAGTMSPFEHGEVFVLDDGGEVDLDLGNYERFLDVTLNRSNNITTGKVYQAVLTAERRGDYLGKTVQVVPHVTDAIITWIRRVAATPDADTGLPPEVVVIELGGTVGDIESMPFIEALRQLRYAVGEANFCSVFVSLVPELGVVGEQKTKPTQHGVKNLSMSGLAPQLIVCRSTRPLLAETKAKLGLFCQVPPDAVVSVHDVSNTYRIPLMLHAQGVCNLLIRSLRLVWRLPTRLEKWARMARTADADYVGYHVPSSPLRVPAPRERIATAADTGTGAGGAAPATGALPAGAVPPASTTPLKSRGTAGGGAAGAAGGRPRCMPVVTIALVGKYTNLSDSYLSVVRALQHSAMALGRRLSISWVESSHLEDADDAADHPDAASDDTRSGGQRSPSPEADTPTGAANGHTVPAPVGAVPPPPVAAAIVAAGLSRSESRCKGGRAERRARYDAAWALIRAADGVLVPGGFGDRGVEGMIAAIRYARESKTPFLGICLGMQLAAVEAVRWSYGQPGAHSSEFAKAAPLHAVIYMPEGDKEKLGGTMRLGSRKTVLSGDEPLSLAAALYGRLDVYERHRHRYEVNPELVTELESRSGLRFVGCDESGKRMEVLERRDHPFFLGTQFHPEFTSRPGRPSPPFLGLLMASSGLSLERDAVATTLRSIRQQDPWRDVEGEGDDVNGGWAFDSTAASLLAEEVNAVVQV